MADTAVSPARGLAPLVPRVIGRHAARDAPPVPPRSEPVLQPAVARVAWYAVAGALLGLVAAVRLVRLGASPAGPAEAATVAQTFALDQLGQLMRPPLWGLDSTLLGTVQLAAWTGATRGFERHDDALLAVREPMVLAAVVAGALLWVLARRFASSRPAAAAAVALLAVAPLAVDVQRLAVPENLAACWVLAALVVAAGRRGATRVIGRPLAAGAWLAVAVPTAPVAVLAVPAVVWLVGRRTSTRGAVLCALTPVAVLAAGVAVSLAVGAGTARLIDDPVLGLGGWPAADPATLVLVTLATAAGLASSRLRPLAVGTACLLAGAVLAGATGAVAVALPLAALLAVGVAERALGASPGLHRRGWLGLRPRVPAWLAPAVVVLVVLGVAPLWIRGWTALGVGDSGSAVHQARQWVGHQVQGDPVVLSDGATWASLVGDGWPVDRAVTAGTCDAGCTPGWLLATAAVRATSSPTVAAALASSVPVAVFGTGDGRAEVRRIGAGAQSPAEQSARAAAGSALASSPRVATDDEVRGLLRAGRVDSRVLSALATLAVGDTVSVLAVPAVPGEDAADQPRRQLLLAVPPDRAGAVAEFFAAQRDPYRPEAVTPTPTGVLVRYPPLAPSGLLEPFAGP